MKNRTPYFIAVALAAAAVLLAVSVGSASSPNLAATTVQSQPPQPLPPNGPPGLDQRLVEQLSLSAAQKEQISGLREQERTASQSYQEQLRQVHEDMRAVVEASTFDEAAARALAVTEGQAVTELSVIRMRTEAAVYQLLTADQRTKLTELRRQFQPLIR